MHINKSKEVKSIISFFVFGVLIFLLSLTISLFYFKILKIIRKSKKKMGKNISLDRNVSKSIYLIIITNLICWFPISILGKNQKRKNSFF